jgi:hypothetical protein
MAGLAQLEACCGVGEIQYLEGSGTPEEVLKDIGDDLWGDGCAYGDPMDPYAHMIFTEVCKVTVNGKVSKTANYGAELAKAIKKHKLGTVMITKMAVNPQHAEKHDRHYIKTYVWTPSKTALKAFWKANGGVPYVDPYADGYRW